MQICTYTPPSWAESLTNRPQHIFPLALCPTPLHSWTLPFFQGAQTFWLKRDDCTGSALSGNKVRKLSFLLAEAHAQKADTILTCGGLQSNHCRATAVACSQLGLECHLYLRTSEPVQSHVLQGNLLLDRLAGAILHPISPVTYAQGQIFLNNEAKSLEAQGKRVYVIPEGGSNALGSWGYLQATEELLEQCKQQSLTIDDVVVACGSGGTAAGLAAGLALAKSRIRVHAVNVCDNASYFYKQINAIFQDWQLPFQAEDVLNIIDGYKGLGYALNTPEELEQLVRVGQQTGIFLDPVYTGKALLGCLQTCKHKPSCFQGNNILFWHTGGIFSLFAKSQLFTPWLLDPKNVSS
ncbi:MAG: pyridoxal-phosphate dependent enzyme [Myxococcota bacterium]